MKCKKPSARRKPKDDTKDFDAWWEKQMHYRPSRANAPRPIRWAQLMQSRALMLEAWEAARE